MRLSKNERASLQGLVRIVAPNYRRGGDAAVDERLSELLYERHPYAVDWVERLELEPAATRAFARALKSYLAG